MRLARICSPRALAELTASAVFSHGIVAPDGRLIFTPNYARAIGIFNTATQAFSYVDISGSAAATDYMFGVLAPNGKVSAHGAPALACWRSRP